MTVHVMVNTKLKKFSAKFYIKLVILLIVNIWSLIPGCEKLVLSLFRFISTSLLLPSIQSVYVVIKTFIFYNGIIMATLKEQ